MCTGGGVHVTLSSALSFEEKGAYEGNRVAVGEFLAFNLFGFVYRFAFGAVLFVHYKIYHIHCFTIGFAVGTKAICRLRFVIHLHTWRFVVVERAF